MTAGQQTQRFDQFLIELDLINKGDRLLIIGNHDPIDRTAAEFDMQTLGRLEDCGQISDEIRADITVVIDQLEYMDKDSGSHLLSRLRDVHSRRVLLILNNDGWSRGELLALGYLQIERPSYDGRLFFHDPAEFHEPREWNNSSNWAHPENFRKRRW